MVSCSKDELINTKDVSSEAQLLKVELDAAINGFTNEYAYFESDEVLNSFAIQYKNLSLERREELTGRVKYLTLEKHFDAIYEGMNDLITRDAFVNYVNNYSNLIEIKVIDGEEEVVEKDISRHRIAPFLNVDRIIKVGEEYRKYIGEFYVTSSNYNDLIAINSTKEISKSGLEHKISYTTMSGINDKGGREKEFFDELENDINRCKDQRKVEFYAYFHVFEQKFKQGGLEFTDYTVDPTTEVIAKRKGIPCIWYTYKTNITWDNFDIRYRIDGGSIQTWTIANASANARKIVRDHGTQFAGTYKPTLEWTKIRSTVGSRGIGAQVLEINE
ncbi:MAG: hypothetical protein AB8G11_12585 [Saprospiraceae bacterium]